MTRTFVLPVFTKSHPMNSMARVDAFAKNHGATPVRLKYDEEWRFKQIVESAGNAFFGRKPRNWRKYLSAWLFKVDETNTSSHAVDIVEKWLSKDPKFNPGYACVCLCSLPESAYEAI